DYGIKITASGLVYAEEVQNWAKEMATLMPKTNDNFFMLIDARGLKPMPEEASDIITLLEKEITKMGLIRAAYIVDNPLTKAQLVRISHRAGLYEIKRFIDVQSDSKFEQTAMDWIIQGIEPD
ncbi:MAG: hypothetical protein ABIJ45_08400, partial [Candidatus Zixiibacteriota bacterium]